MEGISTDKCEMEYTLSFSIPPTAVYDNFFFKNFILCAEEITTLRETRLCRSVWRLGESVRLSNASANVKNFFLDYARAPKTYVNLLKTTIFARKEFILNPFISFEQNNLFPHVIEEKIALEHMPSDIMNRKFFSNENDCSDNNLGIKFIRRASRFVDGVRISFKSVCNEYHEFSYSVELEQEIDSVNSFVHKKSHHVSTICTVFREHILPVFLEKWPSGYMNEFHLKLPPMEWLENISTFIKIKTGSSLRNRERALEYIEQERDSIIFAKEKKDGIRSFGFYQNSALCHCHGRSIVSNEFVPNSIFFFQLELIDEQPIHTTELCLVNDPSYLIASGKRAANRQMEESEYTIGKEQEDPEIGYILSEDDVKEESLPLVYRAIRERFATKALLIVEYYLKNLLECFNTMENIVKYANCSANNLKLFVDMFQNQSIVKLMETLKKYSTFIRKKREWLSVDAVLSFKFLQELKTRGYHVAELFDNCDDLRENIKRYNDEREFLIFRNKHLAEKIKFFQTVELLFVSNTVYVSDGIFGFVKQTNDSATIECVLNKGLSFVLRGYDATRTSATTNYICELRRLEGDVLEILRIRNDKLMPDSTKKVKEIFDMY